MHQSSIPTTGIEYEKKKKKMLATSTKAPNDVTGTPRKI